MPVISSVLGITDSQHFSLLNTSQHLTLSAFLKVPASLRNLKKSSSVAEDGDAPSTALED